jgi:hypothetical protein
VGKDNNQLSDGSVDDSNNRAARTTAAVAATAVATATATVVMAVMTAAMAAGTTRHCHLSRRVKEITTLASNSGERPVN